MVAYVTRDEPVYRPDARSEDPHFFRDLMNWVTRHDAAAGERLERHRAESRAVPSSSFGGLVVPQYLRDLAAGEVGPGAPLLSVLDVRPLPPDGMTVTVPRSVTTGGSSAASQTTENFAVEEEDPSYADLERSVVTIAGQVTVSRQACDRGGSVFEEYLVRDILESVNEEFDRQLINGSDSAGELLGLRNVDDITTVTWNAVPSSGSFSNRLARTAHDLSEVRFQVPTLVVMHPRRWHWFIGGFEGDDYDTIAAPWTHADTKHPHPWPYVGAFGQMAVIADANIPTTVSNLTSNEDVVLIVKHDDMPVHASELTVDIDYQLDASTWEVTFIGRRYAVWFPDRYRGTSTAVLTGTGLADPGNW